jgi:hypothetical protein
VWVIRKYTDVSRGDFLVGGFGGLVTREDLSMEEFFKGEGNFPWRGSRISQHYLKNNQKLNIKKTSFFS